MTVIDWTGCILEEHSKKGIAYLESGEELPKGKLSWHGISVLIDEKLRKFLSSSKLEVI